MVVRSPRSIRIFFQRCASKDIKRIDKIELNELVYIIDKKKLVIGIGDGKYRTVIKGKYAYLLSGLSIVPRNNGRHSCCAKPYDKE